MRKQRLAWNTISSLITQVITIICGFILPRMILSAYGSETNGLVSSINQFLGIISFMECGVGTVVQSALYKPLSMGLEDDVSSIIASANKFFRILAWIMAIYVLGLCMFYPRMVNGNDILSTVVLILAMSISAFAQYYFGITNQIVLTADQKGYVVYILQGSTILINTLACTALIYLGASIQTVKLTTSFIYLTRPIGQYLYVKKYYRINRKIKYTGEPIPQKWNGLAQHIAAVVLENTDSIVLTIFSSLENVSIYSVYYLVVYGIKQVFLSLTKGVQALIGELWAKKEEKGLLRIFAWLDWLVHTGVVIVFGCTATLIVPFVSVYTKGINDANYLMPLFGYLLTIAHAFHCLRLPYNITVLATGQYRQTQSVYIISAALNVIISIVTVQKYGLIGVAIGTFVAMAYQTFWLLWYVSVKIIPWPLSKIIKQFIADILSVFIGYHLCKIVQIDCNTYVMWIFLAIKTVIIWVAICVIINMFFFKDKISDLVGFVFKKFVK